MNTENPNFVTLSGIAGTASPSFGACVQPGFACDNSVQGGRDATINPRTDWNNRQRLAQRVAAVAAEVSAAVCVVALTYLLFLFALVVER